ncbi:MAG TPA: hypothetical protein GX745_00655 [Clostridiales bacterium]|jgi:hypothetical protein|nr:hypothetical protein [Clostridiales bacterium]
MKIKIDNDLYDIANRLKSIDSGYFVVYDTSRQKYEVHNSDNIGNTYCLTVPYERLDARTVDLVNKTRRERFDKIFED